jgi:predicted Zn-dependent protease with MMP-like domain
MDRQQFENLIGEAVAALPQSIRQKLSNVDIILEEGESPDNSLFGLYHGVPQTARGSAYGMAPTLPDKITIYKGTIEKFALRQAQGLSARDQDIEIQNLVRRVVWHEIGHHFGFDEAQIRKLEKKWAKEHKI